MAHPYLQPKNYLNFVLKRLTPLRHPDFLIIGAQKAGTSSLFHDLRQHPKLIGPRKKEIHYFDRDNHFKKGEKWYLEKLRAPRHAFKKGLLFEASPRYLYHAKSARRIYEFDKNLKLIIVLREPVKRAYSAWNMYRDFHDQPQLPQGFYKEYITGRRNNIMELYDANHFPSFKEVVDAEMKKIRANSPVEEPSMVRRGIYLPQIKRYHQLFGRDKVLVLGFKDFVEQKINTLNTILEFLKLEKSDWCFLDEKKQNVRKYPQKMKPEMKERLNEFYKHHNKALFDYLGRKVNW